jgi:hypothetical protein
LQFKKEMIWKSRLMQLDKMDSEKIKALEEKARVELIERGARPLNSGNNDFGKYLKLGDEIYEPNGRGGYDMRSKGLVGVS